MWPRVAGLVCGGRLLSKVQWVVGVWKIFLIRLIRMRHVAESERLLRDWCVWHFRRSSPCAATDVALEHGLPLSFETHLTQATQACLGRSCEDEGIKYASTNRHIEFIVNGPYTLSSPFARMCFSGV